MQIEFSREIQVPLGTVANQIISLQKPRYFRPIATEDRFEWIYSGKVNFWKVVNFDPTQSLELIWEEPETYSNFRKSYRWYQENDKVYLKIEIIYKVDGWKNRIFNYFFYKNEWKKVIKDEIDTLFPIKN